MSIIKYVILSEAKNLNFRMPESLDSSPALVIAIVMTKAPFRMTIVKIQLTNNNL
jgi:hypothetical protein